MDSVEPERERQDVALHDGGGSVAPLSPVTSGPGALLATICTLATNPQLNAELLTLLLDRQERAEAQQAERAFNVAMAACQAEIMPVVRTAENAHTRSKYAKLEHVDFAIRPIYTKHGFALSFDEDEDVSGQMVIYCYASHVDGHTRKYRMTAPPDTKGAKGGETKTELHGRGSTTTFLRRYLTCNVFNVVLRNVDDDGLRGAPAPASGTITPEQVKQIDDLLEQTHANIGAFLDFMGAPNVEDIRAADFQKAMNALAAKKRKEAAR